MTEKKIQIALFEDYPRAIESYSRLLNYDRYSVQHFASNMEEARMLAPALTSLGIAIALVDGAMTEGQRDNVDGAEIVEIIAKECPEVITIGIASLGDVPGAHHNSGKATSPRELFDLLEQIFPLE